MPTHLTLLTLLALLSGCAGIREARMAVPASLAGLAEESFGKPGWGRRGEFLLGGQSVSYERGADRLSLFDSLSLGRAPLRYTWAAPAGASVADCVARQAEVSSRALTITAQPWTLSCRWGGAGDATLQIGESQARLGAASREGHYRRGELTLELRSVHRLEGSPLPLASAAGYEMRHRGEVVASLDLSRGTPRLRRPDPATPLGRAVTEAALALALVWEPG